MTTLPNGVRVRTDLSDLSDLEPTVTDDQQVQPYRWTSDGRLHTDPDGIEPLSGEPSPGDYELAADSEAWSTGEGKNAARKPVADPNKLAAMTRVAQKSVTLQYNAALLEAMTEDEIAEARALTRQQRESRRAHEHAMAQFELDEEVAEVTHRQAMATKRRKAREQVASARQRQQKAADPSHKLVLLSKLATWLPLAALIPGVLSIVLGASNAATELNRVSPSTTVVNWLMEPMFSVGVLVILIAQWLGAVPSALHSLKDAKHAAGGFARKFGAAFSNGFFLAEVGLFALTVLLQVGIHYVGPNHQGGLAPLVWSFVPLGLLISMALVPAVSNRVNAALAMALRDAENALSGTPVKAGEPSPENPAEKPGEGAFDTASHLRGKKREEAGDEAPENPGEEGGEGVLPDPKKKTVEAARAELADAVEAGVIDPSKVTVNAVAKRLGIRWATAKKLLAEY